MVRTALLCCFSLFYAALAEQQGQYSIEDMLKQDDSSGDFPGAQSPSSGFHQQPGGGSISAALGGEPETVDPMANPQHAHTPANTEQVVKAASPSPNKPAQNFVGKMVQAMGGPQPVTNSPGHIGTAAVSSQIQQIVSGLVEAFMHKVQLLPGEKQCLESNLASATSDVGGTIMDAVKALKIIVAGQGHKMAPTATGGALSAGIDGAIKITSLVTSSTQLLKNCVQGDALAVLNQTGHNFINGTYLEDRIIVNGIDIIHSLSDSIVAYESGNYHLFGADVGTALRKVLLSNATNGTHLPEGLHKKKVIADATEGLMKGFFAGGSSILLTDDLKKDVHLKIDLHQCIAENQEFFKDIWLGVWDLIAKFAANKEQHFDLGSGALSSQAQSELMMALMQLPTALANCNINADAQRMILEALQTMGHVHMKVKFPDDKIDAKDGTEKVAKAMEAWTNWDFSEFGMELGKLLREFIMLAPVFNQKYSMDSEGRLLLNEWVHKKADFSSQPAGLTFALSAGFASVALLATLLVVRITRRDARGDEVELEQLMDLEDIEVE